jgi:hypothetical protein
MGELQVALYETQKDSKLDPPPTHTMLSNDCLDNEDVILSCCAGLACSALHSPLTVSFFRMSSTKQEPQYTDHYLSRCPQIVRFRNASSAFMATGKDSYERTIWPSHVSNINVLLTRCIAHAAFVTIQGGTGFLTAVRVTPVIRKRLPNIYKE